MWESITNSDREKARVYANLLKAVGLKGWTSWGNWNQETGSKLITNFEKEPQVSRNLVIAEVMTNYWKRGLKPLNYFLSEDFEGIIEKNWSRYSKDDQLLEKGLSKN